MTRLSPRRVVAGIETDAVSPFNGLRYRYKYKYIYTYDYFYIYMYIYIYIYILCIYMLCIYITHRHIHYTPTLCIYKCICIHIYIHIYICIFVYVCAKWWNPESKQTKIRSRPSRACVLLKTHKMETGDIAAAKQSMGAPPTRLSRP